MALMACCGTAFADSDWPDGLGLGGSVSRISSNDDLNGVALGFDGSYVWENLGIPLWISGGARGLPHENNPIGLVYGEAGVWLGVNLGAGYVYKTGQATGSRALIQGFLGVPVPVGLDSRGNPGIYVEPFFRPLMTTQGKDIRYEVGLLVKYSRIRTFGRGW
jgi:hypothetical protein